jgi:hypothetical protein
MKIFVSHHVAGARDIARHINKEYTRYGYQVFVSSQYDSIDLGDHWMEAVKNAISNCDLFLIIITHGSLKSDQVKDEFLEAKRLQKRIIFCRYFEVKEKELEKWGLDEMQGIEFETKEDIIRKTESLVIKATPSQALLQKVSRSFSEGDYDKVEDYFIDALQRPDISRIFGRAAQSKLNVGSSIMFSGPVMTDNWNFGPDVDTELFLLKIFANLERHFKRKLTEITHKIDSKDKPSQADLSEMQDLFSKLQELEAVVKEILKKQSDTISNIAQNI